MPVALYTFHTYRSWSEANPRGYIQRGQPGVQQPNEGIARHRASRAIQPPMRLDGDLREQALRASLDACERRELILYAGSCTLTHLHLLVGIGSTERTLEDWARRLKRGIGFQLADVTGISGRKWFSRGWDIKRVEDRDHLTHLVEEYLPKHVAEGGVVRIFRF